MQEVSVNGQKYKYVTNYKDNKEIRDSFNQLTRSTYNFDFEAWYQSGYWGAGYVPYSLLKDNKVVANASVNIIDFLILGEKKRYLQIGTVMTDKAFRNLGLSRFLMEMILEEWEGKCDLIYLFANDSVLDFYPRFGFKAINEYECTLPVTFKELKSNVQKLNMSIIDNRRLLFDMASNSNTFSKISMLGNAELVLFYCTSFRSENVFHLPDYNTIVVAEFNEDTCYIQDIFSPDHVSLPAITAAIISKDIKKVVIEFTPADDSLYEFNLLPRDNETLFVKPDIGAIFQKSKLRFPILSHA